MYRLFRTTAAVLIPLILMVGLLAGCAITKPVPSQPLEDNTGAIAVSFETMTKRPMVAYFVRVETEHSLEATQELIPSNFSIGGRAYLLNASPGRYAAVAVRYIQGTKYAVNMLCLLHPILSKETITTVSAGELSFMGDYGLSLTLMHHRSVPIQRQYLELIDPGTKIEPETVGGYWASFWRFFVLGQHYASALGKRVRRDQDAERQFLLRAATDLNKTDWEPFINHRPDTIAVAKEPPNH